jgi:hypothetical protein
MAHDDYDPERISTEIQEEDCGSPASSKKFVVSRRAVVAGIASTALVATPSHAASSFQLRVVRDRRDPAVKGVEVRYLDSSIKALSAPASGERKDIWQLFTADFGGDDEEPIVKYKLDKIASPTYFSFPKFGLFTNSSLSFECEFYDGKFSKDRKAGEVVDTIQGTLSVAGLSRPSKPISLQHFFGSGRPLEFEFDASATNFLARQWFGERIEFFSKERNESGGCRIKIYRDGTIKVTSVLDDAAGRQPAGKKPNNRRSDIWAFESAVKFTTLTLQRAEKGSEYGADLAASLRPMITTEAANSKMEWHLLGIAEDAVWGEVADPKKFPELKKYLGDDAVYVFGEDGDDKIVLAKEPHQAAKPSALFFRRGRDPRETIAALRGAMNATLVSKNKNVPACDFALSEALVVRRSVIGAKVKLLRPKRSKNNSPRDEVISEVLRARISSKQSKLATVYGEMEIAGDKIEDRIVTEEEKKKANSASSALHQTATSARGLTHLIAETNGEELVAFDARVLITNFSVAVEGDRKSTIDKASIAEQAWSRLDFNGTELALTLKDGAKAARKSGAQGVIVLCEPAAPFSEQSDTQAFIALDGAHLRVRRAADNLALSFQFRRLALELANEARIVPYLSKSHNASGVSARDRYALSGRFDSRPLLIANVGPQHVAERAYYRMVNDGVTLPTLAEPENFGELLDYANNIASAAERKKFRKELQERLKGRTYAAFADFLSKFGLQGQPEPLVPKWLAEEPAWQKAFKYWKDLEPDSPQRVYLGPNGYATKRDSAALHDQEPTLAAEHVPTLWRYFAVSGVTSAPDLYQLIDWRSKSGNSKTDKKIDALKDKIEKLRSLAAGQVDDARREVQQMLIALRPRQSTGFKEIARGFDKNGKVYIGTAISVVDAAEKNLALEIWQKHQSKDSNPPAPLGVDKSAIEGARAKTTADRRMLRDNVCRTKDVERERDFNDLEKLLVAENKDGRKVADDQQVYLGNSAAALDPDTRSIALARWRDSKNPDAASWDFNRLLLALPDLDWTDDFRRSLDPKYQSSSQYPDGALLEALDAEKARTDPYYAKVKELYKTVAASIIGLDKNLEIYKGREKLRGAYNVSDGQQKSNVTAILRTVVKKLKDERDKDEAFPRAGVVTPARLSGSSRLVFKVLSEPKSELDTKAAKSESEYIPFTVDGLTNWGSFDLAVTRRAETAERLLGGRIPHESFRSAENDVAKILEFQGIRPGNSIDQRLSDIRSTLLPPREDETAIELPFRLQLSPDQFARFKTIRPVPSSIYDVEHRLAGGAPRPRSGIREGKVQTPRHPLWTTALDSEASDTKLRAVWSDDFRPDAFRTEGKLPLRGNDAPWDPGLTPKEQFRATLDAYDRHELVALSSVHGLPVLGRRSEAGKLVDYYQFEPPVNYRLRGLKPGPGDADWSGIYNPRALDWTELRLSALGGTLRHDTRFAPPAAALKLLDGGKTESLFYAFSVERWRQYTVLGRDIEVEVAYKGYLYPLGIRASLVKLTERRFVRSEKTNVVTAFLIQRKFIRIANPVKNFPVAGQPNGGRRFPASSITLLSQETPDILDPDADFASGGWRDYPFRQPAGGLATPNIVRFDIQERPNGGIGIRQGTSEIPGMVFWPRTAEQHAGNYQFEFLIDNAAASAVRMPLLFVDNTSVNNQEKMSVVAKYYNDIIEKKIRTIDHGSARRRYASENADGECTFETSEWEVWAEGREGPGKIQPIANGSLLLQHNSLFENDPLLEGAEQPPFFPFIKRCKIRVGQAERFVGRSLDPVICEYQDKYRQRGFMRQGREAEIEKELANGPNDTKRNELTEEKLDLYLELVNSLELSMGESGDRSGGIARPEMHLRWLSRKSGIVGGAKKAEGDGALGANADSSSFNLDSFFNSNAKLLGLLTFKDILGLAGNIAPPKLKESIDAATEKTSLFIQQQVLPQIRLAVEYLESSWAAAQSTLNRGTENLFKIEEIYPDVGPSLAALKEALSSAERSSGIALIIDIGRLQQEVRRFISVVTRTLSDPIVPLQEHIRNEFRKFSTEIRNLSERLEVRNKLEEAIKLQFAGLQNIADRELLELLVYLPNLHESTLPPGLADLDKEKLRNEIRDRLATLRQKILSKAALALKVEDILDGKANEIEAGFKKALISTAGDAEAKLKELIAAAEADALPHVKKALEAYGNIKELIEEGHAFGLAAAELFGPSRYLESLKRVASILIDAARGEAHEVLARVGTELANVAEETVSLIVRRYIFDHIPEANKFCVSAITSVAKLLNGVLPASNALVEIGKALDDVANAARIVSGLGASVEPRRKAVVEEIERFVQIAKNYSKDRDKLTKLTTTGQCRPDSLDQIYAVHDLLRYYETAVKSLRNVVHLVSEMLRELVRLGHQSRQIGDSQLRQAINNLQTKLTAILKKETLSARETLKKDVKEAFDAFTRDAAKNYRQEAISRRDKLKDDVRAIVDKAAKAYDDIDEFAKKYQNLPQNIDVKFVQGYAKEFEDLLKNAFEAELQNFEDKIKDALTTLALSTVQNAGKLARITIDNFGVIFAIISTIYDKAVEIRKKASEELDKSGAFKKIAKFLFRTSADSDLFAIPRDGQLNPKIGDDAIIDEQKVLKSLSERAGDLDTRLQNTFRLVSMWRGGQQIAIFRLYRKISDVLTAALRGDIAQFVDMRRIREEVERALRDLIPARIRRSYDMDIPLKDLAPLVFFDPVRTHELGKPKTLVVRVNGIIDLIEPKKSTVTAEGFLPAFKVALLGGVLDVATLLFAPSRFHAAQGESFNFSLKVEKVEFGPAVEFIQKLQQGLGAPKNGSGFYLRPILDPSRLGIVAGYGLPAEPIQLGNMYITNLSLNCAVELPFTNGDARFVVSVARPEAPFMIAVAPYAGAGYLGFIANTKGIVGFEASFEYGGGGGFTFGLLKGEGRITVGVFIRSVSGQTSLYGIFYCGGSARIACFSASASLLVRLSQEDGNLVGEAVYTYSFSVGIRDIDFSITVWKSEQGGKNKKDSGGANDRPAFIDLDRSEYADISGGAGDTPLLHANAKATSAGKAPYLGVLANKAKCKGESLSAYASYFAKPEKSNNEKPWILL